MESLTRLALTYYDLGWSVIPCHVPIDSGCSCGREYCEWPGKHPRLNWTPYSKDRAERDVVAQWFESDFYGSNIGIATGTVSGVAVVDVDHGALDTYVGLHLPRTELVGLSGSGNGVHYFYTLREPMRSGAPCENIDLKADGGFIVIPPSLHMSGRLYRWFKYGPMGVLEPDMLPSVKPESGAADLGWYNELLDGCYEGERSVSSTRLAGRYAGIGLSEREAMLIMNAWNRESVHPPLPEQEIARAVRWAYRTQSARSDHDITTISDIMSILNHEGEG